MSEQQTVEAVAALGAAVDALLTLDLTTLSSVEVVSVLDRIETHRRRLDAVDVQVIAEISERGIAGDYARTSATDLLVQRLRVTPGEARARVERAQDLGPRRAVTGEPLQPVFPAVAAALTEGVISGGHVKVISDCLEKVGRSAAAGPLAVPACEQVLLEAAKQEHPRALARTAHLLLARLDPDGLEPREDEQERRRSFTLTKHSDGSSTPRGHLTPDVTAMWDAILTALAAPIAGDEPDPRTPAQRRHDALAEAASRILRSGTLPAAGGAPVTVLAKTTMRELQAGTGTATTGDGHVISISKLLQMAADAHIIPVICNDTGGILAYGRRRRLASPGQRYALAVREGRCLRLTTPTRRTAVDLNYDTMSARAKSPPRASGASLRSNRRRARAKRAAQRRFGLAG